MNQALQTINNTIKSPAIMNRLAMALGYADAQSDPKGHAEARKYAASVLAEVERSYGSKNDLTKCQPESVAQSMIDAAKFRLEIDGRQYAHLISYGGKATFQIGYRGFIAKIAEFYKDVDYTDGAIYEGDEFSISEKDGFAQYTLERKDPFADESKLVGVFVSISYTKGGRQFQKVATMNKVEIQKVRNCAKQKFIWDAWYVEKALVACIKRASKKQFQTVTGLQEMIRYDNDKNFILTDGEFVKKEQDSITDNLNKKIAAEIPTLAHGDRVLMKDVPGYRENEIMEVSDVETVPDAHVEPSTSDEEPEVAPKAEEVKYTLLLSSGDPLVFNSLEEMRDWIFENAKFSDTKQLKEFLKRNDENLQACGQNEITHEIEMFFSKMMVELERTA